MPGKTVRFDTPSPSYSVASLPSTDGSLSPPPIPNAMLPAIDCQLNPVLLRSSPSTIAWDMSYPVETARLNPAWNPNCWTAPATTPLVTSLVVTFGVWRMTILPNPASRVHYVTVLDVLHGVYRHLRSASSERDFNSLSSDKQKRVTNAYIQRWQRCRVPAEREMERQKGVKLIDYLADMRAFSGLVPTKELGVWQLQVTHS